LEFLRKKKKKRKKKKIRQHVGFFIFPVFSTLHKIPKNNIENKINVKISHQKILEDKLNIIIGD
jgi:hypothetical protein